MEDGERSEPSEHKCPQGSPVEDVSVANIRTQDWFGMLVLVTYPGHCITEEDEGPEGP